MSKNIFKVNDRVYHINHPYTPGRVVSTNAFHRFYYDVEVQYGVSIDYKRGRFKYDNLFKTSKEAVVAAVTRRLSS